MSHIRTQIRAAVIAKLKAYVTAVAGRVLDGLAPSIPAGDLPCIVVRTSGTTIAETGDGLTFDGIELRTSAIFVDVFAARVSDAQTELDDLVLSVEKALAELRASQLNPLALVSMATLVSADDAEQAFACERLEYRLEYRVDSSDPQSFA